MTFSTSAKVM